MKNEEKQDIRGRAPLLEPSYSELRGRQSVRATFRLSRTAIDAISIVSAHLGIKQKSLFDHLLADLESLGRIAEGLQSGTFDWPNRVQKTYVISRQTLSCLDKTSKDYRAPRDALVEYSIQRLLPMIERERERHTKRKEIVAELRKLLSQGEKLLKRSKDSLGEDDPIFVKFQSAMAILAHTQSHMERFVERADIIEHFDFKPIRGQR